MKQRIVDYPTIWAFAIIMVFTGVFIGIVLDRIYHYDNFNQETVIKVQPKGWLQYPYKPNNLYFTTLPEELHRVIWKNGNIVEIERLGYAYE